MAREWSLVETKALVEEHIALKEEEKAEVRTASEHWNRVAKRLRDKGFNRSHKSCNKRWYRLEQCEVQIFSFNMEEGNKKNFWDLTRAERLEFRNKWPQLPSGDGIDKEIFDMLRQFSHRCEKKEVVSEAVDKEVVHVSGAKEEDTRPPQPVILLATPRATATPFSHPMVTESEAPKEQAKSNMWPAPNEQPNLTSQDALDGFKLQARELRRRRAAELRRNNRAVPYSNTHTTFMKAATTTPPATDTTSPFGATLPDFTSEKPSFQLKRPNPFANHRYVAPAAGSSNFQSKISKPELESMNAHMPLLQPQEGQNIMAELGSLEEQLQMILGAPGVPTVQHCEQQMHKPASNTTDSHQGALQFRPALVDPPALAAVGGLGAQLGAVVKLLQAKQAAEQEFRDKMLVFVECMAASLRTLAQASVSSKL